MDDAGGAPQERVNLKVYVRVRPLLPFELDAAAAGTNIADGAFAASPHHADTQQQQALALAAGAAITPSTHPVVVDCRGGRRVHVHGDDDEKEFDHVFDPSATQDDVFSVVGGRVTPQVFAGYHSTVFLYGQTGSGKTYTAGVTGQERLTPSCGIMPRFIQSIFDTIQLDDQHETRVTLEWIQIYNECIKDLLCPTASTPLQIRECPDNGVFLVGAKSVALNGVRDFAQWSRLADRGRNTALTQMNASSSRSHSLLIVTVQKRRKLTEDDHRSLLMSAASNNAATSATATTTVKASSYSPPRGAVPQNLASRHVVKGRLYVVDLAGSERLKKSGSEGIRRKEATCINSSLSTLGSVLHALVERQRHVPYRECKLTRLLQDSLGGSGIAAFIVTLSPAAAHLSETRNTLMFAERARLVRNAPKIHREYDEKVKFAALQATLEDRIALLEAANAHLTAQLTLAEETPAGGAGAGAHHDVTLVSTTATPLLTKRAQHVGGVERGEGGWDAADENGREGEHDNERVKTLYALLRERDYELELLRAKLKETTADRDRMELLLAEKAQTLAAMKKECDEYSRQVERMQQEAKEQSAAVNALRVQLAAGGARAGSTSGGSTTTTTSSSSSSSGGGNAKADGSKANANAMNSVTPTADLTELVNTVNAVVKQLQQGLAGAAGWCQTAATPATASGASPRAAARKRTTAKASAAASPRGTPPPPQDSCGALGSWSACADRLHQAADSAICTVQSLLAFQQLVAVDVRQLTAVMESHPMTGCPAPAPQASTSTSGNSADDAAAIARELKTLCLWAAGAVENARTAHVEITTLRDQRSKDAGAMDAAVRRTTEAFDGELLSMRQTIDSLKNEVLAKTRDVSVLECERDALRAARDGQNAIIAELEAANSRQAADADAEQARAASATRTYNTLLLQQQEASERALITEAATASAWALGARAQCVVSTARDARSHMLHLSTLETRVRTLVLNEEDAWRASFEAERACVREVVGGAAAALPAVVALETRQRGALLGVERDAHNAIVAGCTAGAVGHAAAQQRAGELAVLKGVWQKRVDAAQKALKTAEGDREALLQQLATATSTQNDEVTTLHAKLQETAQAVAARDAEIADLSAQLVAAHADAALREEEAGRLYTTSHDLRSDLTRLRDDLDTATQALAAKDTELTDVSSQLVAAQTDASLRVAELARLQDVVADASARAGTLTTEQAALQAALGESTSQNAALQSRVDGSAEEVLDLRSAHDDTTAALARTVAEKARVDEQLDEARATVVALQEQLADATVEHNQIAAELDASQQAARALRADLEKAEVEMRVSRELRSDLETLSVAQRDIASHVDELTRRLAAAAAAKQALEATCAEQGAAIAELTADAARAAEIQRTLQEEAEDAALAQACAQLAASEAAARGVLESDCARGTLALAAEACEGARVCSAADAAAALAACQDRHQGCLTHTRGVYDLEGAEATARGALEAAAAECVSTAIYQRMLAAHSAVLKEQDRVTAAKTDRAVLMRRIASLETECCSFEKRLHRATAAHRAAAVRTDEMEGREAVARAERTAAAHLAAQSAAWRASCTAADADGLRRRLMDAESGLQMTQVLAVSQLAAAEGMCRAQITAAHQTTLANAQERFAAATAAMSNRTAHTEEVLWVWASSESRGREALVGMEAAGFAAIVSHHASRIEIMAHQEDVRALQDDLAEVEKELVEQRGDHIMLQRRHTADTERLRVKTLLAKLAAVCADETAARGRVETDWTAVATGEVLAWQQQRLAFSVAEARAETAEARALLDAARAGKDAVAASAAAAASLRERLAAELAETQAHAAGLRQRCERAEAAVRAKEAVIDRMHDAGVEREERHIVMAQAAVGARAALHAACRQREGLERNLDAASTELERTAAARDAAVAKATAVDAAQREARVRAEQTSVELTATREALGSVQEELRAATTQHGRTSTRLEAKEDECMHLIAQVDALTAERDTAAAARDDLQQEHGTALAAAAMQAQAEADLKEEVETLQGQLATAREECTAIRATKDELEQTVAGLEGEHSVANAAAQIARASLAEAEAARRTEAQARAEMYQQLLVAQGQLVEGERALSDARGAVDTLDAELLWEREAAVRQFIMREWCAGVADLATIFAHDREEVVVAMSSAAQIDVHARLAECEADLATAKAALETCLEDQEGMEAELAAAKDAMLHHDTHTADLAAELGGKNTRCNELAAEVAQLRDALDAAAANEAAATHAGEEQLQRARCREQEATTRLAVTQEHLDALRTAHEGLEMHHRTTVAKLTSTEGALRSAKRHAGDASDKVVLSKFVGLRDSETNARAAVEVEWGHALLSLAAGFAAGGARAGRAAGAAAASWRAAAAAAECAALTEHERRIRADLESSWRFGWFLVQHAARAGRSAKEAQAASSDAAATRITLQETAARGDVAKAWLAGALEIVHAAGRAATRRAGKATQRLAATKQKVKALRAGGVAVQQSREVLARRVAADEEAARCVLEAAADTACSRLRRRLSDGVAAVRAVENAELACRLRCAEVHAVSLEEEMACLMEGGIAHRQTLTTQHDAMREWAVHVVDDDESFARRAVTAAESLVWSIMLEDFFADGARLRVDIAAYRAQLAGLSRDQEHLLEKEARRQLLLAACKEVTETIASPARKHTRPRPGDREEDICGTCPHHGPNAVVDSEGDAIEEEDEMDITELRRLNDDLAARLAIAEDVIQQGCRDAAAHQEEVWELKTAKGKLRDEVAAAKRAANAAQAGAVRVDQQLAEARARVHSLAAANALLQDEARQHAVAMGGLAKTVETVKIAQPPSPPSTPMTPRPPRADSSTRAIHTIQTLEAATAALEEDLAEAVTARDAQVQLVEELRVLLKAEERGRRAEADAAAASAEALEAAMERESTLENTKCALEKRMKKLERRTRSAIAAQEASQEDATTAKHAVAAATAVAEAWEVKFSQLLGTARLDWFDTLVQKKTDVLLAFVEGRPASSSSSSSSKSNSSPSSPTVVMCAECQRLSDVLTQREAEARAMHDAAVRKARLTDATVQRLLSVSEELRDPLQRHMRSLDTTAAGDEIMVDEAMHVRGDGAVSEAGSASPPASPRIATREDVTCECDVTLTPQAALRFDVTPAGTPRTGGRGGRGSASSSPRIRSATHRPPATRVAYRGGACGHGGGGTPARSGVRTPSAPPTQGRCMGPATTPPAAGTRRGSGGGGPCPPHSGGSSKSPAWPATEPRQGRPAKHAHARGTPDARTPTPTKLAMPLAEKIHANVEAGGRKGGGGDVVCTVKQVRQGAPAPGSPALRSDLIRRIDVELRKPLHSRVFSECWRATVGPALSSPSAALA